MNRVGLCIALDRPTSAHRRVALRAGDGWGGIRFDARLQWVSGVFLSFRPLHSGSPHQEIPPAMSFSLYAATIPSYCQILGSVGNLVAKAEAYCAERGLAPAELIQARLVPDMWPFADQVKSAVAHSLGAIEGVRRGVFSPDRTPAPGTFTALQTRVAAALAALEKLEPAEVNGFVGRDMRFEFGERRMDFTAEDYLLSFAQPNFYFHATTAYDVLRARGVPLEKRHFTGRVRVKKT
jgi:hypothetical protein